MVQSRPVRAPDPDGPQNERTNRAGPETCRTSTKKKTPSKFGSLLRPLRDVLWRHRDALLDLPPTLQCRCKKEDICASGALLWHLHRDDRRAATRAGTKRHGACVESGLTEWLVPSQAVAARHNATTELCGFFV